MLKSPLNYSMLHADTLASEFDDILSLPATFGSLIQTGGAIPEGSIVEPGGLGRSIVEPGTGAYIIEP
jgi:hypothetical protein